MLFTSPSRSHACHFFKHIVLLSFTRCSWSFFFFFHGCVRLFDRISILSRTKSLSHPSRLLEQWFYFFFCCAYFCRYDYQTPSHGNLALSQLLFQNLAELFFPFFFPYLFIEEKKAISPLWVNNMESKIPLFKLTAVNCQNLCINQCLHLKWVHQQRAISLPKIFLFLLSSIITDTTSKRQ